MNRIEGTWLVEDADKCTCNGPSSGVSAHEPGCGMEPLVDLATLPGWGHLVAEVVAEKVGGCVCNTGPDSEGPSESCPQHGRSYTDWVEWGGQMQAERDDFEGRYHRVCKAMADGQHTTQSVMDVANFLAAGIKDVLDQMDPGVLVTDAPYRAVYDRLASILREVTGHEYVHPTDVRD